MILKGSLGLHSYRDFAIACYPQIGLPIRRQLSESTMERLTAIPDVEFET